MKYKCVLFDLDGTILNTIESITYASNEAMKIYGFPEHTKEEVLTFVNYGSVEMIRRALLPNILEKEKFDEIHDTYAELLKKYSATMNKAYEGIENVCKALKEGGIKLCVMSNKPQESAEECINTYFPSGLFENVRGSVPEKFLKPQENFTFDVIREMGVNKEDCILVGDSFVDCQTAKNAKLPFIWVSWGYGKRDSLNGSPTYIATTPKDILDYVL